MPPVLLSRTIDPVLGVFTGCLAYYLFENNPRTALPPGNKLGDLIQWKWTRWQEQRSAKLLKSA
ncbi:hypothetical protein BDV98DRAFT_572016 [Pterulicium gracile]|uniref:Uncharacterized protein n=1 Tax=Pterulicium gracile TaxID=1884261 RepID=A0A5C3QBL9_9AGAR|nr:hypothetical protein BDV98DRAFT_572016 [Pterula gracilis]